MKKICSLLLFTASAVLSAAGTAPAAAGTAESNPAAIPAVQAAAAKPAETKPAAQQAAANAAKPAETSPISVLTSIYRTYPDPSAFAEPEKAESLIKRHAALVQKIQDERKRLLQEDTKAKALREEITRLNRELASLLETKKTMIELNSQLNDLDIAISRLKPAPPPPPPTEVKDEATGKVEKTEQADKAKQTDTTKPASTATKQADAAKPADTAKPASTATKQTDKPASTATTKQTGKEK